MKIPKKKNGGSGESVGVGRSGRVWGGGGPVGGWVGQGGCERRIEVFVKIPKKMRGSRGGGGQVGGRVGGGQDGCE